MYLKRLELLGFKSFANKTVLDFPAGITAVVGPNGSGKSNIIDAVRWILGEREAKNIRGAKAEDLIFAGTPQKVRLGMAQVTMIFDNSQNFFQVDYSEVSIKRQVTRDGASEYFLNDAQVRLKDIIDFFAKARLGTKGLTIVNQGNSDIFVKSLPRERRVMIEEVLGLRQYQLKKHEAELKLANTRINLEKVKALVDEIAPHLRLLRRQAAKYEKQADLDKELKDLEKQYFGGKLKIIDDDFKALEPEILKLEQESGVKHQELKQLQAELQKVEKSGPKGDEDYDVFKKKQSDLLNQKANAQKELGRVEGQLEFLLSQPKSEIKAGEAVSLLEETKGIIKKVLESADFSAVKNLLESLIVRIEKVLARGGDDRETKVKELEARKSKLLLMLTAVDEEFAQLSSIEEKLAGELREFNVVFKKAFEEVEAKKDEVNELGNKKNKLLFEKERVSIRRQELENLAAQTGRKMSDILNFGSETSETSEVSLPQIDFAEVERRMFKLRGELAGIGDLDPALIKEAQETESRHNFLTKQSEDLEKATDDLEALIKELDDKIHDDFAKALHSINERFNEFFRMMFGGGKAYLKLQKPEVKEEKLADEEVVAEEIVKDEDREHKIDHGGIEVEVSIPRKKISGLEMLSGGERALVSIAALFALISVSPPPFLVLDEIDAALDENNTKRFADLIKNFSQKTQFILVTHNRATMEAADILYGVTMQDDGTSRVLSVKME